MDLAKNLAQWRDQSPEQWVAQANRFLPPVAMAVLVLAIAYELAGLTWRLTATPAAIDSSLIQRAPAASASTEPSGSGSLAVLNGWKPFGEPPAVTEQPVVPVAVVDAPDTTLNLNLFGVQARPGHPESGEAMISSGRGEQKVYFIGDTIEGGNGATLHSIYADRVLLNRGGRLETLRLPVELQASANAPVQRPSLAPTPQAAAGGNASSLRDLISDNASRFTEIIRPVPHAEGGQMIGFRLTPGRDREAFAALGLEPGDVLTEVNGMTLNDPQSAAQVFTALGETSMANLTVLRNGAPMVLAVDMTQIESLTENRQ